MLEIEYKDMKSSSVIVKNLLDGMDRWLLVINT